MTTSKTYFIPKQLDKGLLRKLRLKILSRHQHLILMINAYRTKILRISDKHMLYKVFNMDDSTKLCYSNYADVIKMTQQ